MKILIDNATITAAQRALGNIKVADKELFELDVSALRVLIDCIVLGHELVVIDNYQEEFSAERKEFLNYDFVNFEKVPKDLNIAMLRHAKAHVYNWGLTTHLATDFSKIFDDLGVLFRHAWRNSESFLVLKSMGVENKYGSAVTKSLREYLLSSEADKEILKKIAPKNYNHETLRVAQSIAWAAIRTVYYRQAAKFYGCEYVSHPLRNLYNAKCILFDNHPATRKTKLHSSSSVSLHPETRENLEQHIKFIMQGGYMGDINKFFRNFWQTCNKADDNVFGVETFDIDMPPFLAHSIKTSDGRDVLKAAISMREDATTCRLREILSNVYIDDSPFVNAPMMRELSTELRELKQRLQVFLGYERERVGISVKMIAYNLTVPRFMTKPLYPHKPHLAMIRDVILELASVSTMGRLIDLLWKNCHEGV